ncbi:antifreeze protein [Actibacterium sp.]|uniref:antifreeze protein n=1 Tax=Actibacterium sp. TaxID=1872125 RepID=UPI0035685A25
MILTNTNAPTPLELFQAGLELTHLTVEAHMVITMRCLGWWGLWAVPPEENHVMVGEKLSGLAEAVEAAQRAIWRGDRPDQVATAALQPIRVRTYENSSRLSQHGVRPVPKLRLTL